MKTKTIMLISAAIFAFVFLAKRASGGNGGGNGITHPKFKVDDHLKIIGEPLSVEFVVVAVYPGPPPDYGTYTMGQWFNGQIINILDGYSIEFVDRAMELV